MTPLLGRDAELGILKQHLTDAISGKGSTVIISGEPGIGKTALVEEFRMIAEETGARILSGAAMSGSAQPFQVFSKALEGLTDKPLFEEQEYTSFTEIFAVNSAGLLLAKASSEEGGLDADIFAGMLSAVQDFVRDSFGQDVRKAGLGRLEYGDMKILIEHGQHLFLTAVFSGTEHPDMKNTVTRTLKGIEERHGRLIEKWTGKMSDIKPVQEEITKLAGAKFLVRKDLEGVKLENERLRIADRVLETIVNHANEGPVAILLEDLRWADESSLFVLNYLARNIRSLSIMILGTARPKESPALDATLERMRGEEIVHELELKKLEMSDVVCMVGEIYPNNDFPTEFMDSLGQRCGGNPLFVVEFLRQMVAEGAIVEKDDRLILKTENYTIPDSIDKLIQIRLDSLDPDVMALAEYAACMGRTFRVSMALANPALVQSKAALDNMASQGIITFDGDSAVFSNSVLHSSVYEGIALRWKTLHHRDIGVRYETLFRGREDEVVYDLANHFHKGAVHTKAARYCVSAAVKAEQSYSMETAASYYEMSIESFCKSRAVEVAGESLTSVWERLGDVSMVIGRYGRAMEVYRSTVDNASDDMMKARALRKVANVHEKRGEYSVAMETLEEGLALVGDVFNAERGLIISSMGIVFEDSGDLDEAMEKHRDAMAILESCGGFEREILGVSGHMARVHYMMGEYEKTYELSNANMVKAGNLGDRQLHLSAMNILGIVKAEMGDYPAALGYVTHCLEEQRKAGDIRAMANSYNNIGVILMDMGDYALAKENYGKHLEICEKIGETANTAMAYANMGEALISMGDYASAAQHHGDSARLCEKLGDKAGLAFALWGQGKAYLRLGAAKDAKGNAEYALEISRGIGLVDVEAKAARLLGMISAAISDYSAAEKYIAESIAILTKAKIRRGLVESYAEMARMLTAKGDSGRAAEFYGKAVAMFEEMGLQHEVANLSREIGCPEGKPDSA